MFSRRSLLRLFAVAGFSGTAVLAYLRARPGAISGKIVGGNSTQGHKLRDRNVSPEKEVKTLRARAVIAGGGIAGLSAAWWLRKHGFDDFLLLELDDETGGNSKSGANPVSAYPWGAHYVPLPGSDAAYVKQLFEELGVIKGYDDQGRAKYNDYYLCSEPEERLFINGSWQEGLIPSHGLGEDDRREIQEFLALMERLKNTRGNDGRRAFTIPLDLSSRDETWRALDRISMDDFMSQKGWKSKYLHWYVDYCCRDDFGRGKKLVSAWSGLHYFASRDGKAANAEPDNVLTWPEGNGWLAKRLREKSIPQIRTRALVSSIQNEGPGVRVKFTDTSTGESFSVEAEQTIFCGPRFVGKHVVPELKNSAPAYLEKLVYAPWMVANVTLDELPTGGIGTQLAWDNVSYYSRSLGYIVATHQNLHLRPRETVLTYYLPLDAKEPNEARLEAADKSVADWTEIVMRDLERHHKGIRAHTRSVDVMIWGHGMISPEIGFLWSADRARMKESLGQIHFAHSDMSGISIFEEAQYHGIQAAEKILKSSKDWKRS